MFDTDFENTGDHASERAPLMPYDAWSDLSIRLNGLDPEQRTSLLEDCEVESPDFERADRHWLTEMLERAASGDLAMALAYGERAAHAFERRGEIDEPRVSLDAPATPMPVPEVAVPTFMLATAAEVPELDRTAEIDDAIRETTLPFRAGGASSVCVATEHAAAPAGSSDSFDETVEAPGNTSAPALPFKKQEPS